MANSESRSFDYHGGCKGWAHTFPKIFTQKSGSHAPTAECLLESEGTAASKRIPATELPVHHTLCCTDVQGREGFDCIGVGLGGTCV